MKTKIQVLSVENKSGRAKTGNEYNLNICQCIAYPINQDGVEELKIGELVLPKGHDPVTPGMYEGEFGITVGQDKRIGGRLLKLTPIKGQPGTSTGSSPKP